MYKLVLGLRYFRSRFLTAASFLAIALGVALLVIVLALMGGYLIQLQENIRGQESHLQIVGLGQQGVTDLEALEEVAAGIDGVTATAPFVERLAVYRTLTSFRPFLLKAVDPVEHARVSKFAHFTLRRDELDSILEAAFQETPPDEGSPSRTAGEATPSTNAAWRRERSTRAIQRTQALLDDPDREDLAPAELEDLFSREWRTDLLLREGGDAWLDPDVPLPHGILVGLQVLLDGDLWLGDVVEVVTVAPENGEDRVLSAPFVVVGAMKTGDHELDSGAMHAELSVVKNWLPLFDAKRGSYRYEGLRVAIDDPARLDEIHTSLRLVVGAKFPLRHYEVYTWRDLRRNMLKAVAIEKFIVYFLVLILVVFTGSMILLMLLLTVIEKTRDIGVLMALGATPGGVSTIFLVNGLVICVAGTVTGLGLGVLISHYLNDIHDWIHVTFGLQLFKPEIYHMDRIPIAFEPLDIVLGTVPPVIIGLVASLVPAIWAPRRDPIQTMQYDS